MNWLAAIIGGIIGASVVHGLRWWMVHIRLRHDSLNATRSVRVWQRDIDREALESRGVVLPDSDGARIVAARGWTQPVGNKPMKRVYRPWGHSQEWEQEQ